jgi:hypothetical protein
MDETMVKCKTCGEEIPQKEILKHYKTAHPRRGKETKGKAAKEEIEHRPTGATMNPVQAAIMEFVGEKLQLPMTPALIYGYFCAKKMGFDGNVAEFITEVIDDFFQYRGINYYEEVMKWEEIGKKAILEEEMRGQLEKAPATGTGAK